MNYNLSLYFIVMLFMVTQIAYSKNYPTIIVNHDLYAHNIQPIIDGNASEIISPMGLAHHGLMDLLINAKNDVLQFPDTEFSLNLSYGQHFLPDTIEGQVYENWICSIIGPIQCNLKIKSQNVDNLIKGKLESKSILQDFLNSNQDIVSETSVSIGMRMNDYHHMESAKEFFEMKNFSDKNLTRRTSAMSPEFIHFFEKGMIISNKSYSEKIQKSNTSKVININVQEGSGPVCQRKVGYFFLDYSKKEVLDFKVKQIEKLILNPKIRGVELDFTRSACLFSSASTLKVKQDSISYLISEVHKIRNQINLSQKRYVNLTLRTPIDIEVKHTGINLDIIAKKQQVDRIIISRATAYYNPMVLLPPELVGNKKGRIKVYGEVFHIADINEKVRRFTTLDEVLTSASQILSSGFHGVSLFNMQYSFLNNKSIEEKIKFSWRKLIECIASPTCLKSKNSYYLSRSNAPDSDLVVTAKSAASIKLLLANPQTIKTSNKRAFLRIQIEDEDHYLDWRKESVYALVNGTRFNLINTTKLPGVDPAFHYPNMISNKPFWKSWKNVGTSKHAFIPQSAFRNGMNNIKIHLIDGKKTYKIRSTLVFD